MSQFTNTDTDEIKKFDDVAQTWWDPEGEMGTLHTINPLRLKFITDVFDLAGKKVLDVGCGGGILTEALARSGAQATGIDLSRESIEAAKLHASQVGLDIEYRFENIEDTASKFGGQFDAITCMEMLEHVPEPGKIIAACSKLLKPGGHAFFSTINRTPKAFIMVIFGGEYILRLLPRGTHTYSKLIRPSELKYWAKDSGLEFRRLASLIYNPFTRAFKVVEKEDNNYMAHFVKPTQE
ncbi:MAG TPA: bifunctional 2-polyprenyl-6-hydroxyphenol methylase/3-demethylubiquinol 3-O-methyltransferase UbiG [Anaerolineales bacterium]|nr:bifunctional 2-polyprenyl-6-hydroxyphenol methylase/3-demethylubiquinol 3-O-methyltransferase UbiG [Anaerolineales bacterium]